MPFYCTLFPHLFSTDEDLVIPLSFRMTKKKFLSFAIMQYHELAKGKQGQTSSKGTNNKLTETTRTDSLGGSTKYSGKRLFDLFFQNPPGFHLPKTEERIFKQLTEVMFYSSKTTLSIPILLYKKGESSLLNQPGEKHFSFQGQIPAVHFYAKLKTCDLSDPAKTACFQQESITFQCCSNLVLFTFSA